MSFKDKSENKNLLLFFVITFIFSWMFWIPKSLISHGFIFPTSLENFILSPFNPAAFGPFVAAFILTYLIKGKNGVLNLLKRGINYRFSKKWLIPIFLLMPLIFGGSLLLLIISGQPVPDLSMLSNPLFIVISFFYILFLGGPLQEEFGWRGYALDRLQANYNALISSIILGFIWGFWHLPLFFMPEGSLYNSFFVLLFSTILVSILFTWIYNNTNGSILTALIFHTMLNLSIFIFPVTMSTLGNIYSLILLIIAIIIVKKISGLEKLKRIN